MTSPLTREQIEAMEGPELDAMVAEHVMGWQYVYGYNYWMTFEDDSFQLHGLIRKWHPSADPKAAGEVAAKASVSGDSPLAICRAALLSTIPSG